MSEFVMGYCLVCTTVALTLYGVVPWIRRMLAKYVRG